MESFGDYSFFSEQPHVWAPDQGFFFFPQILVEWSDTKNA